MKATAHRWLVALLGTSFAAKLAAVLWGVNRGFDIGDGGFFLLCLNHPAESPPLFEFYKLLLLFDPPLRFGVIEARLLRIATELVATLALVHGVFRFAQARLPHAAGAGLAYLLAFTGLGALLSVAAREFGYNDATNLLIFSACACLFRLLALPAGPEARTGRLLFGAGAGLLLGLQLFVKFPAALLLGALAVLSILAARRVPAAGRAGVLAAFGAGIALAIGLFVASNGGVAPLLAKWRLAREVNEVTGYRIAEILRVYVWHDFGSHVNLLRFALVFAVTFAVSYALLRRRPAPVDRALTLALAIGGLVLVEGVWTLHAGNVHPWLLALHCLTLLLCVVCWALAWRRFAPQAGEAAPGARATATGDAAPSTRAPAGTGEAPSGRGEALLPLWLLCALPFVAMAGTNVALTLRLPTHVAPLFLFLAVLAPGLRASGLRGFSGASLAALFAVSGLVFQSHHLERPYGLPSPLRQQIHPVEGLPGLRVDAATRSFLEGVRRAAERGGYRPGDAVVALDFMPGLVHYLDARSPGFPFYPFDRDAQACWAIERAHEERPPFLILGQDMTIGLRDCIRSFSFPDDFRRLAVLANPYEFAIPYFFGGPPMPYVQVFGPVVE